MIGSCLQRLVVALALAAPAMTAAEPERPLTADERLRACLDAEDVDPSRAIVLADSILSESHPVGLTLRIHALGCRAWSQAMLDRHDEARRDAHEMRILLQRHPATPDRARLTRRVGTVLHRSGDRIGALEFWAQALADAEAQDLEAERIPLLINLGVLHSEFEEHERARVNYEQALTLMARLGDHRHEAPVRFNLGLNLNGQGRFGEAVPHLQRTLDLVLETGVGGPMQQAAVRVALATALQESGDFTAAREHVDHVRGMQLPLQNAETRVMLARLEAEELADAGEYEAALELLRSIELDDIQAIQASGVLRARIGLLERLGRHDEAVRDLRTLVDVREAYLRHRNHERLAALESHLRDREQGMELERLQGAADLQARRLAATARLQWVTTLAAGLLLLVGSGVLLWQRRMNRRLDRISRTDPLTGLSNRRDMVAHLRAQGLTASQPSAVLLIDIDLFKRINDEYGHDVGDRVLVAFAGRLRECAGAAAQVARWGGEEFLVLLRDVEAARVAAIAESLRRQLAEPIDAGRVEVSVQVSMGFSNLPIGGERGEEAWQYSLQLADRALYMAKASGRDAWAGFWVDQPVPEWPAERIARESRLACSKGIVDVLASRNIREPLAAAS